MKNSPPAGSVLARQERLGREQLQGVKPPWEYVMEEESSLLLFQLERVDVRDGDWQLLFGGGGSGQPIGLRRSQKLYYKIDSFLLQNRVYKEVEGNVVIPNFPYQSSKYSPGIIY